VFFISVFILKTYISSNPSQERVSTFVLTIAKLRKKSALQTAD